MNERALRVWLIDDDASIRWVLERALRGGGMEPRSFESASSALGALRSDTPDVLVTDIRMPGTSGLELLKRIRDGWPLLPVIVMTAHADLGNAVSAYESGAFEYLPKPFDVDQAVELVRRAAQTGKRGGIEAGDVPRIPELLGRAPAMQQVFRAIGRLSRSSVSVLITGESGTGKELVARALHEHSPRGKRPFIALNTAAIPSELLESELFGHEKGAFTGADAQRRGRFEQADGGTLFLDEIGDMSTPLQTRLLRVLAEGEFFRVGGRELIRADVRVLAATHQDLEAKVERGEFRADLLHRLDVLRVHVPPLRERRDDIAALAAYFLARVAAETGAEAKHFAQPALAALREYAWPGNVRQLENLCRRLAVLASGRVIGLADLPPEMRSASATRRPAWSRALAEWAEQELAGGAPDLHARALAEFERVLLDAALVASKGHRQNAARALGLGRNTLTRKLGSSRTRRPK